MKYHYFFPHGRPQNGSIVYAVYKYTEGDQNAAKLKDGFSTSEAACDYAKEQAEQLDQAINGAGSIILWFQVPQEVLGSLFKSDPTPRRAWAVRQ